MNLYYEQNLTRVQMNSGQTNSVQILYHALARGLTNAILYCIPHIIKDICFYTLLPPLLGY